MDAAEYQLCANLYLAECNWLVRVQPVRALCDSCRLTRTRPRDDDTTALAAFAVAEQAKRRLIAELHELGLPIVGRDEDPEYGLAFDLLSSATEKVFTGHDNGVITLDLAEGDDVHREQLRIEMDEPYRTLLGHFRHEVGHYYFYRLVGPSQAYLQRFNELFGDPDADYQQALDRHYDQGPPAGWEDTYVSSYATMHPAEDWAETFAHYLHIRDTLDTAASFGLAPRLPPTSEDAGPQWLRHHHSDVAAAGVVAEHGEPVDGQGGSVPLRAAGAGAGEDALHPHRHRRGGQRGTGPLNAAADPSRRISSRSAAAATAPMPSVAGTHHHWLRRTASPAWPLADGRVSARDAGTVDTPEAADHAMRVPRGPMNVPVCTPLTVAVSALG